LGVQVVPSSSSMMNMSFLYTDVNKYSSSSNVLATFSVPWKIRKYVRLGLKVTRESVRLFGRCMEPQTVAVIRDPMELLFDSASTLYIGQAGPLIKGPFDVSSIVIIFFFFLGFFTRPLEPFLFLETSINYLNLITLSFRSLLQ